MFGKFPEINRNYLQAVAFTMFKVFPDFLDSKDTILLVTFNDELDWNGGLGPQQSKRLCFWGCRLGWYKMNAKLYAKYSIEYRCLVLIRVSLRAANCAWPWLDIKKKKSLIWELFRQAHLNWSLYPGWCYKLDMIGQLTSWTKNANMILIFLLG